MQVFIPTYGRHARQHTYNHLPEYVRKFTTLVVQHRERDMYRGYKIEVLPEKIRTIAPARQYIMESLAKNKVIMLDDDLRFDIRRMDEAGKFYVAKDDEIIKLFKDIGRELDIYHHVGVLAREGGNRILKNRVYCTRMMRVLAYNAKLFRAENIKFDRLPLQEDFDVTLQLLRKGYKNSVICNFVQGQGTSNAAGGCSHFRTIEMHSKNALKLAALHKPFVKVVKKQTKGAWNGQPRLDVMVQWKKAYQSANR